MSNLSPISRVNNILQTLKYLSSLSDANPAVQYCYINLAWLFSSSAGYIPTENSCAAVIKINKDLIEKNIAIKKELTDENPTNQRTLTINDVERRIDAYQYELSEWEKFAKLLNASHNVEFNIR